MKRAMHYTADVIGTHAPKRFYHEAGRPSDSAARAFAAWAQADVTLLPIAPGVYTAQWFDRFADTFRETRLVILEERI